MLSGTAAIIVLLGVLVSTISIAYRWVTRSSARDTVELEIPRAAPIMLIFRNRQRAIERVRLFASTLLIRNSSLH